jgi:hypothetical protein
MEEMVVNAPEARGSPAAAPTRATVTVNVWPVRSADSMVASLIVAVLAKAPVPQPVEVSAEWTTLPDDPNAPTTTAPAGSGSYAVVIEPADGPSIPVTQAPRTRTVHTTAWPDYRDEVEASLHVAELTYSPADGTLTGTLECRRPPIALAYDLTLHPQGGSRPRDVSCGSVNFDRGGNGSVTFSRRIPNLNASAADLFFEYSDGTSTSGLPADAVVWSSPVVLRNVPIRRITK